MKRNDILAIIAVIAIILVALCFKGYVIFALLIFLPILIYRITRKKDNHDTVKLMTIDDAHTEFGEPDDIIVADATRANEAAGCILVYKQKRALVIGGEPISMDDITDVTSVNTATPYTVGQYQVVFTTKRADRQYIRLDVGMDAEWARNVAMQVIDAMK